MTTEVLLAQKSICVYAVLYVKHVRQRGYFRSFYHWMQDYKPTAKDNREAHAFDLYLRRRNLIIRTGRQTYEWNRSGNIILMKEIVDFLNSL